MSVPVKAVTVLGGYGVFGSRIAQALVQNTTVRIAGRNARAGANLASRIGAEFMLCDLTDVSSLRQAIDGSYAVIHAAGPFQGADYRVAESCLACGAHYIDLADGREFVCGINRLDSKARERGLMVVSGVSSTPAITWAMIEAVAPEFVAIESIHTALSPGNQNPRGASTIAAVLSYLGRDIGVWHDGHWLRRPGWGDVERVDFPAPVGRRRVHNCDVPELEIFPSLFGARTVRFSAGLELDVLNYLLSLCALPCSWFGWNLSTRASFFLKMSLMLYPLGTTNGSLAVWVRGRNHAGLAIERQIALVTDYDGPATPTSAAITLTRKLLTSGLGQVGAFPATGLLTLDELLAHLQPLGVWCVRGDESGWQPRAS